jgi:hypothetical protein
MTRKIRVAWPYAAIYDVSGFTKFGPMQHLMLYQMLEGNLMPHHF